ncbi:unnamed protein product, partial [marine sediment metagenome]
IRYPIGLVKGQQSRKRQYQENQAYRYPDYP